MLHVKISRNKKMTIEFNGEKVEFLADKNVILTIITEKKNNLKFIRDKIPTSDFSEETTVDSGIIASLQGTDKT